MQDALSDTASRIEKHIADQGDRIAILEQRQWYTAGAAAAIAWCDEPLRVLP